VNPALSNQKDLTYLELPPDEQKVSKRPDTNIISDKDRIATSHAPQLDRQELKKILDASRPGPPGTSGQQTPQPQPAQPNPTATQNSEPQPSAPPPPASNQNQIAKLQTPPPALSPKAAFGSRAMSPGSAIEQATRAVAANPGGYGGDSGDYGLGQGRKPRAAVGPFEILSDTMGVDFGPYLQRLLHVVRENWVNGIPESAVMKKGRVVIEFAILKDGTVAGIINVDSSCDSPLDRAAYAGIKGSFPCQSLPSDFGGPYLGLRFAFYYNMEVGEIR
jgi:outer membrane biosynthesis protein TonB